MSFQIKDCGYNLGGFGGRCQIAQGKLATDLNSKQHSRECSDALLLASTPECYWKTRSWSNRPSRRGDRPTSQLTHHSLTWASMRARRSSSSFLFRMFSFSCLASDTAWRNWSKMPKNSSGCILPASSPKCFTALVNWKEGGFSKSGVPREFHYQIPPALKLNLSQI